MRLKPQGPIAIDQEDAHVLTSYSWSRDCAGYARTNESWVSARNGGRGGRRVLRLHRLIMGAEDGEFVDHMNGDILDNRRCNLRVCTALENSRNMRAKGVQSRYKGVCRGKGSDRWISRIRFGGKQYHLGTFDSERSAALAYDAEASRQFGAFARLNFAGGVA